MPLTPLQRVVAKVLRPFRTRHSYIAGGAALNRDWPRLSDDMDLFYDHRDQLPDGAEPELQALREAGFSVEVLVRDRLIVEAILHRDGSETKVQWFDDPETSRRFFPALADDELGFRLHPADNAVNKVLCAARRREPRDAVDLLNIADRYSPLGPLVWAVTAKDTDLNPLQVIRDIRRTAFGYSEEQLSAVRIEGERPFTRQGLRDIIVPALDGAHDYCEEIAPVDFVGCLFVDSEETPVAADDGALATGAARAMPLKEFGVTPRIGKS